MRRPSPASVVLSVLGLAAASLGVSSSVGAAARGTSRVTPVVQAVQRAAPAVVNVTISMGGRGGGGSRGSGAGVIVHPEGYVVTNSHVVRGATRVYCSLARAVGGQAYEARVVEDDPSHDLALLRIAGGPFPYVTICSTCEVMVGETAIAIGNPYGLGDTVTVGIVSATGRSATFSTGQVIHNLIQTDASINLGNSGGALLNLDGDLIGINAAVHANAQGIAFTVPADDVQRMLDRALGPASRPAPAPCLPPEVSAIETPRDLSPALPEPEPARPPAVRRAPTTPVPPPPPRAPIGFSLAAAPVGVLVAAVTPNSNADIAGLQSGDVILDVDGKAVASPSELAGVFKAAASGRTFFATILRGDRRSSVIVVVP